HLHRIEQGLGALWPLHRPLVDDADGGGEGGVGGGVFGEGVHNAREAPIDAVGLVVLGDEEGEVGGEGAVLAQESQNGRAGDAGGGVELLEHAQGESGVADGLGTVGGGVGD